MAYLEKLFPRTYRKLYDYDLDKFFVEEWLNKNFISKRKWNSTLLYFYFEL
jgi:hypothetical protein